MAGGQRRGILFRSSSERKNYWNFFCPKETVIEEKHFQIPKKGGQRFRRDSIVVLTLVDRNEEDAKEMGDKKA